METCPENPLEKRIRELEKENKKLKKKIEGLQKTMEITTRHSDVVTGELEGKVEASVKEIEERVRLISETIPVPIIIAVISDGKIMYVNEHSCRVFGFSADEFIKINASELYYNHEDRKIFLKALSEKGSVHDFEVRLKKSNGELLWTSLFSQFLDFKDKPCVLTVIYDLTERRKAEDEIRRLRAELDQKKIKYLIFRLDNTEYGIEILNVREILKILPITPVKNLPSYVKGVINIRGKIIPVTDLRLRLGLHESVYTESTCIIILEIKNKESSILKGIIVDAVKGVCEIRVRDIESFSEAVPFSCSGTGKDAGCFVSGIAKSDSSIKILINCSYL